MKTIIKELEAKLRAASAAFYNGGTPLMSDDEFDADLDRLAQLDPSNSLLDEVGSPSGKVPHIAQMYSLDKVKTNEDLAKWQAGISGGEGWVVQHKMDGGSAEIQFLNRKLVRGVTRGNGVAGQDITHILLKMDSVRKELPVGSPEGVVWVRGEVMLTHKNWAIVDPQMSTNPRNVGNGIMTRDDDAQAHLLTFFLTDPGTSIAGHSTDNSRMIQARGIWQNVVDTTYVKGSDDAITLVEVMRQGRSELGFDIDGAVIKVNSLRTRESLGFTSKHPRGEVAFKWPSETMCTPVLELVLTTGHTGLISPVLRLEPKFLGGVIVKSVLVNNWDEIGRFNVAIGDTVEIKRGGEIIPKLVGVTERCGAEPIPPFCACPVCGGKIGKKKNVDGTDTVNDYCLNPDCEGKSVGKVKRWLKCLEILGIGKGLLNALCSESGPVKTPADLYRLTPGQLAAFPMGNGRVGLSRAESIIQELCAKVNIPLHLFIGALGAPRIGRRQAEIMIKAAGGRLSTLSDWNSDTLITVAQDVSMVNTMDEIATWFSDNEQYIERLAALVGVQSAEETPSEPEDGPVDDQDTSTKHVFLLTGKFDVPKREIHDRIVAAGHAFEEDFRSNVTCLVTASADSTSSKAKKAIKTGIPIITLDGLDSML